MSLYSSSEVLQSSIASAAAASTTSSAPAATATASGWTEGTCVTDDAARLLIGACEFYLSNRLCQSLNRRSFLTRLFPLNETAMTSAAMTPAMCQNFCSKYAC